MTITLRKKEILIDILVRLPAKSLIRFLCVCKSWSDLIGSSSFVSRHLNRNVMKHAHAYLLCLHHPNSERDVDHDDENIKQEVQWSLFSHETFEESSKLNHPLGSTEHYGIYGSSNGLVCISDEILNFDSHIHIWNPSVRKVKTIPISTNINVTFKCFALQFGFHPGVNDYKVVRMMRTNKNALAVEVYSLRTDSWKMTKAIPRWLQSPWKHHKGTFLKGVAYQVILRVAKLSIMSFDSGSEEFDEIIAPNAICSSYRLSIDVYKEHICLLSGFNSCEEEGMDKVDLWVLQGKVWEPLTPFTFPPDKFRGHIGISIGDQLLMEKRDYKKGTADLYVCNYLSEEVLATGIKLAVMKCGGIQLLFVITYGESLVLLNN